MTLIRLRVGIALIVLSVAMHGCGVYSFTGGGTQANTITIEDIYNNADMGPANMGQDLTDQLKNYFVQNTKLSVVQEDGELHMTGEISGYTISQIATDANGQSYVYHPSPLTTCTQY